jgi:hypothetical protein
MKTSTTKKSSSVECRDRLHECIETVTTLAGLLEASGKHPRAELLEPAMVSRAGALILAETKKAGEWLDKLDNLTC